LRRGYYYFAIVEDLFLRVAWVYILLMNESGLTEYSEAVVSVFACLEVIRRYKNTQCVAD
jgi:hypothetical protein